MINKQQVDRHFGRMSQYYDDYAVVQKAMGERLQQFVQKSGPFQHILEIGCGTGSFTRRLAQMYLQAKIVASDISQDMLKVAGTHLADCPNIRFIVEDGENLQLSGQFDLIVSNAAFQWFNDYRYALSQMVERLRPGGHLIYATFGQNTFYELNHSFRLAHQALEINSPFCHGPQFISVAQLRNIAIELGLSADFYEEDMKEEFMTVKDFLTSIKKIGANNAAHNENIIINRRLMLTMIEYYEQNFLCQGQIPATYHVIYGSHKKEKSSIC